MQMSVKRTAVDEGVVKVHVRKNGGANASGQVRIYVEGESIKTITLSNGKAQYTLTGLPDAGVLVSASYLGKGSTKPTSKELGLLRY